jgi:cytoskeletal protein RodZ
MPDQLDDGGTNEDRFGRQDAQRHSTRSSVLALVVAVVVIGLLYLFWRQVP